MTQACSDGQHRSNVPESVFTVLRMAPHELVREFRIAATIQWYQQRLILTDQAAEFAGMSQAEFLEELVGVT